MGSNIRSSSSTNVQYFVDTSMTDDQVLCAAALTVTAGTSSAIFTSPNGTPPIAVTKVLIFNKTAVTGANTVAVNVGGAVAITALAQTTLALNGVSVNSAAMAATAIALQPGASITITQATGTVGTIVVLVYGTVLPTL